MARKNESTWHSGNKLYINPSHIVSTDTTENSKVIWSSDIDWGDITVSFNNGRTITSTADLITIIEELWNAAHPNTVAVTGVTINDPKTITLNQGQTGKFTATVSPANATNKGVTWQSSATGVATVNASGVVTWKGEGSATITVKTNDGGYTATGSVTCNPPAPQVTYYWYVGTDPITTSSVPGSGTVSAMDESTTLGWHNITGTPTEIQVGPTARLSANADWYIAIPSTFGITKATSGGLTDGGVSSSLITLSDGVEYRVFVVPSVKKVDYLMTK